MMKRLLSLMMAAMMLLGAAGSLAEPDAAAESGNLIPAVGEVVNGFAVKEIRDYPLAGGQLVLFEHEKTGAPLLWIANEDTNRAFQIGFRTRPHDDMGIPHVFEHATLFGSEKYPSSSLFFNLNFQTYNTYLNAYTTDAMTAYPFASLSEKQLLKLADYYVDSCFHPMIMTDESIFRTQAWHYNLPDAEGEMTYEGVVYSEMKGAMTLGKMAMDYANDAAFPGSALSYSYGGLPEAIPELTWEDVKNFHNLYYHPSNSFTILYGQLDDWAAFLKLLDDEFQSYEKKEFPMDDAGYTPITEAVVEKHAYPVAAGTDTTNQSVINYYLMLPGMKGNEAEENAMDHLCLMLNRPGSFLQQSMKKRFPAAQVSCGRELAGPDDAVIFSGTGLNENDAEEFKALVDAALADAAGNGFSEEMADSVMAAQQLNAKLTMESGDPVNSFAMPFMYSYSVTGNPFANQETQDALSLIGEENRSGALKKAAGDWLVHNELYTLTTTYPAPGEKEKQDAELAEKLAAVKAGMSAEQLRSIIDETNAEPKNEDTAAMMAQLKAVGIEELPEEIRRYEVNDQTDENGIRYVEAEAGVDGVGQVHLMLDAAALPETDIHWARLFIGLLGQMDTDAHTKEELDLLIDRYMNGREFSLNPLEMKDHSVHPYLDLQWIAMDEDLEQAYQLAEELLFHTQFTDTAKLADLISAQKTSVRNTISSASYQIMLCRGLADQYPAYRFMAYANYVEYYSFLEELEKMMAENPERVSARLREIQSFFANRAGAVATYAGGRDGIAVNHALAQAFLMKLESTEREAAQVELPVPSEREALIVDGNIQFNCVIATMDDLGMDEFDYGLQAVCQLVADQILMPVLRDQMGVYTPLNAVVNDKGMYLITYRDPSIRETFEVYAGLADQIAAMEVQQDTLDGYIMSAYSALAKPSGELTGAADAIQIQLSGLDPDLKLNCMRQLKKVTPETVKAAAEYYRKAWENGVHSTSGSAGAIQGAADLYETVLNPFGAKDATQTELADLPADHPAHGAMRFLFENGLMPAAEDDRIRPDEESTVGDLAAALFAATGLGTAEDPEEAVSTLAQYGLMPADAAAGAPLTWGLYDQVIGGLAAASGQQLPPAATEENRDTAMTRGELAVNLAPVFGYAAE